MEVCHSLRQVSDRLANSRTVPRWPAPRRSARDKGYRGASAGGARPRRAAPRLPSIARMLIMAVPGLSGPGGPPRGRNTDARAGVYPGPATRLPSNGELTICQEGHMARSRIGVMVSLGLLAALGMAAAEAQQAGMTFFVTSAGSGKGADFGGLAGADKHCQSLAAAAGAGNRTSRAYLSASAASGSAAVN